MSKPTKKLKFTVHARKPHEVRETLWFDWRNECRGFVSRVPRISERKKVLFSGVIYLLEGRRYRVMSWFQAVTITEMDSEERRSVDFSGIVSGIPVVNMVNLQLQLDEMDEMAVSRILEE